MNPSVMSLKSKLNWQLDDLNAHLDQLQQEIATPRKQIQELDEKLNRAQGNALSIIPELEISRLSFVIQQQEKKDSIMTVLKGLQEQINKLNEQIKRTKTELKMLDKYIERHTENETRNQQKIQDNALDEWVIQRKEEQ